MISQITHKLYKAIREHGGLSVDEVAAAIGRKRQVVYRIEGGEQLLTHEQEGALIKKANLSREALVEIICKVLSEFLGQPVVIAPSNQYLPTSPLMHAADFYSLHHSKLDQELRDKIEDKLGHGRMIDASADQICRLFGREIRLLIEQAVEAEGPPDSIDD